LKATLESTNPHDKGVALEGSCDSGTAPDPPTTAHSSRVLVVDDDRDGAEALAILLRLAGHTVETAYDGVEALSAAERFRPQVVLLDVAMPDLDGFDVAVRMRARGWASGLKVIAVTGHNRAEDRELARRSRFDGYLLKPVDFAQLSALLSN
jgi:CheY-like chemotaxis protein